MVKEIEKNEKGICPCKACKRKHIISYPEITKTMGIFYAKCTNPECNKYDPYEFVGLTEKSAIRNWNDTMGHESELNEEK